MLKQGRFVVALVGLSLAAAPAVAQGAAEALVNTGSPPSPFPQNKQNEPTVAIDPTNPSVLAAGSNDEIDEGPCVGSDCPFVQGIGNSGIYFSFDGGTSWSQPTYQGWSDRTGTPGVGPIGTLPHYYEAGLVSDGDPVTVLRSAPGLERALQLVERLAALLREPDLELRDGAERSDLQGIRGDRGLACR